MTDQMVLTEQLRTLNPNQRHHLNETLTGLVAAKVIKAGDVVFDVGANVGYHTHAFASLAGPGGYVHAFEPNPDLWKHLISGAANIRLWPVAVGEHLAISQFFYPVGSDQVGSLSDPRAWMTLDGVDMRILSVCQIAIDQLDEATARPVSFIKVDVETHELQALRGMTRLLCRDRPVMIYEGPTEKIGNYILDSLKTNI